MMPLTHAKWADNSETYAALIARYLYPGIRWLDAGCGSRLLEEDLDSLENWLVGRCGLIVGIDLFLRCHRNIKVLVRGSLYALPFADDSLDLVTCNMVVEHLEEPARAISEITRCLRRGGLVVIQTPWLANYGVMANAVAARIIPQKWRFRLVHASDHREPHEVFPVRYRANTLRELRRLFRTSGLEVDETIALSQNGPYVRGTAAVEKILMRLTPKSRLLVCAHKVSPVAKQQAPGLE